MKHIILHLILLVTITSCSTTYLFSDIDSANISTWIDQQGYFHSLVEEDDSAKVIHSFDSKSQQLAMSIINESSKALYIDWSKSEITINQFTEKYNNTASIKASANDNITCVEPYSQASIKVDNFQKTNLKDLINKNNYTTTYSEDESPYQIKNHLTFYRTSEEVFNMNETFFVSKVIRTSQKRPKYIDFERGNLLYAKSSKVNYKQIGEIAATVVIIPFAIIGYAAADLEDD